MTKRRCLGCQTPALVTDLIPLHLVNGGSIRVGPSAAGRGGWIHPECLHTALIRPSLFHRCFRCRVADLDGLPSRAIAWVRTECKYRYTRALHDGLVVKNLASGHTETTFTRQSSGTSDDDYGTFEIRERTGLINTFTLKKPDIEAVTGHWPANAVQLKPGRSTQSLLRSLRAWDKLG